MEIYMCIHPRQQNSWGQHGAHLGPVGPRRAPSWPHEPCYQGCFLEFHGRTLHLVILRCTEITYTVKSSPCSSNFLDIFIRNMARRPSLKTIFSLNTLWSLDRSKKKISSNRAQITLNKIIRPQAITHVWILSVWNQHIMWCLNAPCHVLRKWRRCQRQC